MALVIMAICEMVYSASDKKVGWLVVLDLRFFETVFQSISGRLPERGRKKRELTDERKMSKQTPPHPLHAQ